MPLVIRLGMFQLQIGNERINHALHRLRTAQA
jgi:hypothetical protein